jgi:virulence-associated protein VapD
MNCISKFSAVSLIALFAFLQSGTSSALDASQHDYQYWSGLYSDKETECFLKKEKVAIPEKIMRVIQRYKIPNEDLSLAIGYLATKNKNACLHDIAETAYYQMGIQKELLKEVKKDTSDIDSEMDMVIYESANERSLKPNYDGLPVEVQKQLNGVFGNKIFDLETALNSLKGFSKTEQAYLDAQKHYEDVRFKLIQGQCAPNKKIFLSEKDLKAMTKSNPKHQTVAGAISFIAERNMRLCRDPARERLMKAADAEIAERKALKLDYQSILSSKDDAAPLPFNPPAEAAYNSLPKESKEILEKTFGHNVFDIEATLKPIWENRKTYFPNEYR